MKQKPKYQDPNHIKYVKDKYGPLDRNKKEIVGNPEGGKETFWILYIAGFILYIFSQLHK